jgi:hypothetical protein
MEENMMPDDQKVGGKSRRKRSSKKQPQAQKSAKATQRVELATLPERALETVSDQAERLGELAKDRPAMATLIGVAGGVGIGLVLGMTIGARLLRH